MNTPFRECPDGYRILLALPEAVSAKQARDEAATIFGPDRTAGMIVLPGCKKAHARKWNYDLIPCQEGFRVCIPKS